jgi:Zn-dependent membrane protease YugP
VPIANIGNTLWSLPFFLGLMLASGQRASEGSSAGQMLMSAGILMFGAVVVFQLVTLPVEFDASRRAKAVLAQAGIVQTRDEAQGVDKVLDAAAMTGRVETLPEVEEIGAKFNTATIVEYYSR